MKINEVLLDEGIVDAIKSYIPGTAGNTVKKAASVQADKTKKIVTGALQKWAVYKQKIQSATGKQPTAQDVVNWYTSFSGSAPIDTNPSIDPTRLNQWLTNEISNYILKKTPTPATAPTAAGTQSTVAPQSTATISALGKRGSASTAPQQQAYQSPLGITVISSSDQGHVLGYENKKYWPNNRGDWAINGKDNAAASPQLQAEMDKVAGFA